MLPPDLINDWATTLNREIETIDRVIGEVCTPHQIYTIRQRLNDVPPGLILGRCKNG
jgi:hypothetical protein